jgi:hypothetical protein
MSTCGAVLHRGMRLANAIRHVRRATFMGPASANLHRSGAPKSSALPSAGQPDQLRRVDHLPKCWARKAELVAEPDAGIPDHFCPFGRFFLDDRGKLGRRVADRLET